jgi:hypothetical protein
MEYIFRDTHKELPDTYAYLESLEGKLGKKIIRTDFGTTFDHLLRMKGGMLPSNHRRWCTELMKLKPFEDYIGDDFPFGRSALYQDLDEKGNVDRSNFGRTGELLYMMLARAGRTEELRAEFSKLLSTNSSSDRVVQKLQPENVERAGKNETGGYLPYRKHPAYERLAEDWLAAFALNLPGYDAYAHLVPLGLCTC